MSWFSPTNVEARRAHVMELYALGYDRKEIAERVDITPQRVSQIVNSFGYGWREKVVKREAVT